MRGNESFGHEDLRKKDGKTKKTKRTYKTQMAYYFYTKKSPPSNYSPLAV
jgi:hypothetical protein